MWGQVLGWVREAVTQTNVHQNVDGTVGAQTQSTCPLHLLTHHPPPTSPATGLQGRERLVGATEILEAWKLELTRRQGNAGG